MSALQLRDLQSRFEEEVRQVHSEEELVRLKAAYLGKKGYLSTLMRGLGDLPVETRPLFGAEANDLKQRIEEECRNLLQRFSQEKRSKLLQSEEMDLTLPGRTVEGGGLHPITQVLQEVETIFREIGFSVFEGPEIETDYFNFETLNIPAHHPARDMQDTFYLRAPSGGEGGYPPRSDSGAASDGPQAPARRAGKASRSAYLLRTHTSPVQIHVMKKRQPPIRMIAPGVVYRRDSDVSHTPMFHQVEGLVVGEGVRFSDLKGVVSYFLHRFFGSGGAASPDTPEPPFGSLGRSQSDPRSHPCARFRPSYFPFTEPSAEVDIVCFACAGKKTVGPCRLCKGSGWLEVMGCGMVHPAVFENVGYDPARVRGFAFGMGIERLAMLRYAIPDIRLFFENDLRFLRQFS